MSDIAIVGILKTASDHSPYSLLYTREHPVKEPLVPFQVVLIRNPPCERTAHCKALFIGSFHIALRVVKMHCRSVRTATLESRPSELTDSLNATARAVRS